VGLCVRVTATSRQDYLQLHQQAVHRAAPLPLLLGWQLKRGAQHLTGEFFTHFVRNVAQAQHADHCLVAISDRHAPNLPGFHCFDCDGDVVLRRAADNVLCHYVLGHQLVDIAAVRHSPASNVAVRDDANELTIGSHWHRADVGVAHVLCDFCHESTWLDTRCASKMLGLSFIGPW